MDHDAAAAILCFPLISRRKPSLSLTDTLAAGTRSALDAREIVLAHPGEPMSTVCDGKSEMSGWLSTANLTGDDPDELPTSREAVDKPPKPAIIPDCRRRPRHRPKPSRRSMTGESPVAGSDREARPAANPGGDDLKPGRPSVRMSEQSIRVIEAECGKDGRYRC